MFLRAAQRQRASKELGFSREKKYLQTISPAGDSQRSDRSKYIAHAFIFDFRCLLFAQMQNALWELIT
jgi:hypothetical protein